MTPAVVIIDMLGDFVTGALADPRAQRIIPASPSWRPPRGSVARRLCTRTTRTRRATSRSASGGRTPHETGLDSTPR